jgi:hypothetical protein
MQLTYLVERMPPVACEWSHLGGPASRFDSFSPFTTHQDVRTIDFVDCGMARTIMRDHSFFAADAYDERLTLHARDGVHARYLQEIGDVFGVVYLVKERLLIGVHIHGGDEYIFGFERHLILHLHGSAFRSLAGQVRECTQPRFHRDIEGIRGERLIGVSGVSQGGK